MTPSSGLHTPKHTLLSDVLVTHSFLVLQESNIVSVFLTNDRKQLREVETVIGRKLWNYWNIPLRDAEASNHWHTLWRKVCWVSQLGHYELGYSDGETATLRVSCGGVVKWGISDSLLTVWLHIKLYFCKNWCWTKDRYKLQNVSFPRGKKNSPALWRFSLRNRRIFQPIKKRLTLQFRAAEICKLIGVEGGK